MDIDRKPFLRVERTTEVCLLADVPRRTAYVVAHLCEGSRCVVVTLAEAHLIKGDGGAAIEREILLPVGHGSAQFPTKPMVTTVADMSPTS